MNLLPKSNKCDDLEDPEGHYKLLGCSKVSSTAGVADVFKDWVKEFREFAKTNHPDKTQDTSKHADYERETTSMDARKETFKILGTANCYRNVYPDRVNYDCKGEGLRAVFHDEILKTYPGVTYDDQAKDMNDEKKRGEIFAQGHATQKVNVIKKGDLLQEVIRIFLEV